MSRRRYISTELSTDSKIAELSENGLLPLLLYTWAIPHMDDWGRISGDARQFKLLVCPGLDITTREVEEALIQISSVGLWVRYEALGKWCICIPDDSWFKHQSYINKSKRHDDSGSNFPGPPKNAEDRQGTPHIAEDEQQEPNNSASFSLSSSVSSSKTTATAAPNAFRVFEEEGFGTISSYMAEKIGNLIDEYSDRWVIEAMKEAVNHGKRMMAYVESILKRYKSEGIDEPWTVERKPSSAQRGYSRGNQQKKPQMDVVKDNGPKREITPEERERMLARAKKLKEESGVDNGQGRIA